QKPIYNIDKALEKILPFDSLDPDGEPLVHHVPVCQDGEEVIEGQFKYVCHFGKLMPQCCLSSQGAACIPIGQTRVEGHFIIQCYTPQEGVLSRRPVGCFYNGHEYYEGQVILPEAGQPTGDDGGSSSSSNTSTTKEVLPAHSYYKCFLDNGVLKFQAAGCVDDSRKLISERRRFLLNGRYALCLFDENGNFVGYESNTDESEDMENSSNND
uniref:Uncharacterized protein n=1 Tax=Romanomermis culicivorax TaxID=13658 RepID=A0A915KXR3_ROMCU